MGSLPTSSKYWSELKIHAVVDAWRRSGKTAPAFARRHGLQTKRIKYWSERLSRAEREPPTLSLVPATVGAPDLVAVIQVGDVAIELTNAMPDQGRGNRPGAREVDAVILVPRAVRVYFSTLPRMTRKVRLLDLPDLLPHRWKQRRDAVAAFRAALARLSRGD